MTTFTDLYRFDVEGNFDEQLRRMDADIKSARAEWSRLRAAALQGGAALRFTKKEMRSLGAETSAAQQKLQRGRVNLEKFATAGQTLAAAQNRLIKEQNRLNAARASEATVIDRANSATGSKIIQARAEERALRRLSGELQRIAERRIFEQRAAEAGLRVSADGTRLFDAEAAAARRAAQAVERLQVAEALRRKGLDAQGRPVRFQEGTADITAAGRQQAAEKALEESRQANFERELNRQRRLLGLPERQVRAFERVGAAARRMGRRVQETEGPLNRVSFTFRRLIGIMAAFTVARRVVQGFTDIIRESVRFNSVLEQNRVGLAGLIAAAGDVRDSTGAQVDLSRQLEISQNIAIDQNRKLRLEALKTAASYEEIATAFSTAVAPGLTAGLTLDQIRSLTVQISQAATGLGVAQNQLAEEIRSLLQGTITPRNTRIATALGISNEDIRRAKEVGELAQFLNRQFAAISATGERLMDTFVGALSNARDAFQQLLSDTSGPFVEQLKAGLKDIQGAILETTQEGEVVGLNESALRTFSGLFEGLAEGIRSIREAFTEVDPEAFASAFSLIGTALGTAGGLLAKSLATITEIVSPTLTALQTMVGLIGRVASAAGQVSKSLGEWPATLLRTIAQLTFAAFTARKLLAVTVAIQGTWRAIQLFTRGHIALLRASAAASGTLSGNLFRMLASVRRMAPYLLAIAAILTLVAEAFPAEFGTAVDFIADKTKLLFDEFDRLLNRVTGFPEQATEITTAGLGIVVNNLRTIYSQLEDTRRELSNSLVNEQGRSQSFIQGLGVDQTIQAQIAASLEQGTKALEQQVSLRAQIANLAGEQNALEAKNLKLQQEYEKGVRMVQEATFAGRTRLREVERELSSRDRAGPIERAVLNTAPELIDDNRRRELDEITVLENERSELLEEQARFLKTMAGAQQTYVEASEEAANNETRINLLKSTTLELEKEIVRVQTEQSRLASIRIRDLALESAFNDRLARAQERINEIESGGRLAAVLNSNKEQLALVEAVADRRRASLAIAQGEQQFRREELRLTALITEQSQRGTLESIRAAGALFQQLQVKRALFETERATLINLQRIAEEEERRRRILAEGGIGEGFGEGLRQFREQNQSVAQIGVNLAQNFNSGLAQFAGSSFRQSIAAALDPEQNFDLAQSASSLALDIGSQLVTDTVATTLANALGGAVEGAVDSATQVAGATSAAAITTTAATTAAGTWFQSAIKWGGVVIASATKAAAILGISTAVSGGTGGAKGGVVRSSGTIAAGFAKGGRARPKRGLDPRDVVPAWLRPGEWVIRPEAVRAYGNSFFQMLNSRKLDPSAIRAISQTRAPVTPQGMPRSGGFAEGGPVNGSGTSRRSSESQPMIIAQFNDEQTMDQALAAGPNAMLRFTRRRRASFLSALGLSE